jgi:hypothetical protein
MQLVVHLDRVGLVQQLQFQQVLQLILEVVEQGQDFNQ